MKWEKSEFFYVGFVDGYGKIEEKKIETCLVENLAWSYKENHRQEWNVEWKIFKTGLL